MHLVDLLRRLADAELLPTSGAGEVRGRVDLEAAVSENARAIEIDHVADDHREVRPGGLFVAVRGAEADGHAFIEGALENGAAAVLCEEAPAGYDVAGEPADAVSFLPAQAADDGKGAAIVRASDTRAALAEAAAAFYGDPSHEMKMVGVTGTNGKTTTAHLVRRALSALGERAALIGTVETDLGAGPMESTLTTPGALQLQKMLRAAAQNGCTAGAMEVSSHALDQGRTRATRFVAGIFTNLTSEHLDYHGDLEAYRAAKKRLFDALPAGSVALYNADDPAGPEVVAGTEARKISFGESGDVRIEIAENSLEGLRLALDGAAARRFRLVGRFNAYNLAAAYAAARAMGYEAGETLDALAEAPPVPGRFEQVPVAGGRTVIVDYAHTPDALENALRTLGEVKEEAEATRGGTLWCVFGCGGDRDRSKRPAMGRVAERLADRLIVTSDNPRTEDPAAIMEGIRGGLERPAGALFVEDRGAAIEEAARRSQAGDVVLIAGKGHETYQTVKTETGTERRPFDDRQQARKRFGAPPASHDDT